MIGRGLAALAAALALLIPAVSARAQNPPAVLYGPGVPGDRVEALVGGRTCASATVGTDGYWLLLLAEGGVCGARDGDVVGFRVNGQSAAQTTNWRAGGTPEDQASGIVLSVTLPPSGVTAPPQLAAPPPPSAAPVGEPIPARASNAPPVPVSAAPAVAVGMATPLPMPIASAVVDTAGDGVAERFSCAADARRGGSVREGAAVMITFAGIGPCEGWYVVDAGGRTTWLEGRFLSPSSLEELRRRREPEPVATRQRSVPITEVRIVSRLRWYERLAQDVEPAGLVALLVVFLIGALVLLPKRNRWP